MSCLSRLVPFACRRLAFCCLLSLAFTRHAVCLALRCLGTAQRSYRAGLSLKLVDDNCCALQEVLRTDALDVEVMKRQLSGDSGGVLSMALARVPL